MATTSSSSTQDNGTDKFHPVEGRIEKNGATAVSVKRISITFKVAKGWRGTKSRDFPGRTFIPQDGDILQQWAGQFRKGDNLVQRTKDTRTVEAVVEARFRKPYSGPTEINRTHAFRWYRDTQDRLLNGSKKVQQANALKGIDDLDVCLMAIDGLTPNTYELDKKVKRTSKNEFIEVVWGKGFDARYMTNRSKQEHGVSLGTGADRSLGLPSMEQDEQNQNINNLK